MAVGSNNIENNNKIIKKHTTIKSILKKIRWISLILSIVMLMIIFFPKIRLAGNEEITINYNETYKEPGYSAGSLFINNKEKVIIDNQVTNGKVGEYHNLYTLKYGLITIKKERIINIVDNIDPIIEVADSLKVCPSVTKPEISYKAYDEYDGDLTTKVMREDYDNKIVLSVTDKANNYFKTEVNVIKEDNEKPQLTLKGNSTIYLNIGANYSEPGYSASDNCDGDITDKVEVKGSVNKTAGSYKLTYTVSDNAGNIAEIFRTVIVRSANLYNNGSIGSGTIYLTFDDGPREGTTNVILDILKEEGIKATFFVTSNGPDYLIQRIVNEGHTIALHTASHNYQYVYSSVDNYFADLNKVSERVKNLTGVDSKIIRFPGGSSNTVSRNYQTGIMTTLAAMVLDRGYRYYDWNVDSGDAGGANTSIQVYNNVTNGLSGSRANMVLMHDIKPQTRDALKNIIKFGKDNGFKFEKITTDTYMIRHGINN